MSLHGQGLSPGAVAAAAGLAGGGAVLVAGASGNPATVTGTAAETQMGLVSIPPGLLGTAGLIRVNALWSYTGSAFTKTPRMRYSGSGGQNFISTNVTTTSTFQTQCIIAYNGATNSQKASNTTFPYATGSTLPATNSADGTVGTTVYFSGQLASSIEAIKLEYYLVEVIPAV